MSNKTRARQYADSKGSIIEEFTGLAVSASGTSVPVDGTAGYAPGCDFYVRNGVAGANHYINEGTGTSCAFKNASTNGVDLSTLAATAAEINRTCKNSTRPVSAAGAALTVTQALHDGKTILLDQATGTAVTLPAAAGTGTRLRFFVSVTKSGGSDVITAAGAHIFGGVLQNNDTGAAGLFGSSVATNAGGSTTITLNGTTTGGRKGDWIELEDVATNTWFCRGQLNGSGTEATPFA